MRYKIIYSLGLFMKSIFFCILFLSFVMGTVLADSPGIKITEPADGFNVTPGQQITVRVEAVDEFILKEGFVGIGNFPQQKIVSLPGTFSITIPNEVVGKVVVLAFGYGAQGKYVSDRVDLSVQLAATLQSLEIDQDKIYIPVDWDGNLKQKRSGYIVSVYGIYSDGIKRNLDHDPDTIYVSSDPSVITIDATGNYQIHKKGEASITVSNSRVSKTIPLDFEPPRGIRPSETVPPVIQMDIQPPANAAGWRNQDIAISLVAQDNEGGSGVSEIVYSFPNVSAESHFVRDSQTVIPFSQEGINLFRYGASDKERNNTGQQSTEIKLDKTPPLVTISSPEAAKEYILGETIPVTYTSDDALSSIETKAVSLDGVDILNQVTISPGVKGSHSLTVTAVDKAGNSASGEVTFTVAPIRAQATIKPEVFLRSRGAFIAVVRLPKEYKDQRIVEASCDGAPAVKIISTRHCSILIFKRQDITQLPLDTTFTVTGKLQNNLFFEGTDTIKKILPSKGSHKHMFGHSQEREVEERELDHAIDEFCGSSSEEKDAKHHIRHSDD